MDTFTVQDLLLFAAQETSFLNTLDSWELYPENLSPNQELEKLSLYFAEDFRLKEVVLSSLASEDTLFDNFPKPSVVIDDYHGPVSNNERATITTPEELRTKLKWPQYEEDSTNLLHSFMERAKSQWPLNKDRNIDIQKSIEKRTERQAKDEIGQLAGLKADPGFRFIFLETSGPFGRSLNLTKEMLFQILTYHQVSPCYLNFISYFDYNPLALETDAFLGGFRHLNTYDASEAFIPSLDRSGCYLKLTFEFKAAFFFPPPSYYDSDEDKIAMSFINDPPSPRQETVAQDQISLELSLSRLKNKLKNYKMTQAAVYHHLDIMKGNGLWIITGPKALSSDTSGKLPDVPPTLMKDFRNFQDHVNVRTENAGDLLQSSLDTVLWLSQWSLSEFSWYIETLDEVIRLLTDECIKSSDEKTERETEPKTYENRLKETYKYLEDVQKCIASLDANVKVCDNLHSFYQRELLKAAKKSMANGSINWIATEKQRIDNFSKKMKVICKVTQNLARRATLLSQAGSKRQVAMQNILQAKNNEITNYLLVNATSAMKKMDEDSTQIKAIALVTYILLPMTLTSTFFATDVVKFQDVDTLLGHWSRGAILWFATSALILVVLFYLVYRLALRFFRSSSGGGPDPLQYAGNITPKNVDKYMRICMRLIYLAILIKKYLGWMIGIIRHFFVYCFWCLPCCCPKRPKFYYDDGELLTSPLPSPSGDKNLSSQGSGNPNPTATMNECATSVSQARESDTYSSSSIIYRRNASPSDTPGLEKKEQPSSAVKEIESPFDESSKMEKGLKTNGESLI